MIQTQRRSLLLFLLGLLPAVALLLWNVSRLWGFTIDDAYITFRYSQHLAQGYGPVWNIGGDPVEGYTNFLLMLLLAGASKLGLNLPLAARGIGVLSAVGISAMLFWYCWRVLKSYGVALAVSVIFVASLPVAIHAVSGLETMLFSLLLTLLVVLALQIASRSPTRWLSWGLALVGLLLPLTRPEGALALIVVVIGLILCGKLRLILKPLIVITLLPGLLYFLWRWSFFGYPLPNTFYVKAYKGLLYPPAFAYLRDYLLFAHVPFIIGWLIIVALLYRVTRRTLRRPQLRGYIVILLPTLILFTLYYLTVVTDSMGYDYRFVIPGWPLLLLVVAAAAVYTLDLIAAYGRQRQMLTRLVQIGALIGLTVWLSRPGQASELPWVNHYTSGMNNAHIPIGKLLAASPYHGRLAVIADAGATPFYADWQTLDVGELNDEYLAHHGFSADYVFDFNPDVFVITSYNQFQMINYPTFNQFVRDRRFSAYERVQTFFFDQNYWQFVYLKRGDPRLEPLRQALRAYGARQWQSDTNIPIERQTQTMTLALWDTLVRLQYPTRDPQHDDTIHASRQLSATAGQCYRFHIEVEDGYTNPDNPDQFEQRIYLDDQLKWSHDISGDTFSGWQTVEFAQRVSSDHPTFTAEVIATGKPIPGSWWGTAATIALRKFSYAPSDACS